MDTIELDALLGDYRDALLEKRGRDGYDDLLVVARQVEARWPGEDDEAARREAFNAALMMAFGDVSLSELGDRLAEARRAQAAAMEALTGALLWADRQGVAQTTMAEEARVTRVTVRRALGL